jgi:hypothetical protein
MEADIYRARNLLSQGETVKFTRYLLSSQDECLDIESAIASD